MDQTGKQLIVLDGKDTINIMAKKTVTVTNEEESVIIMDGRSIGLQSDTISIEGRKSITLLSGGENMILSGEKKIIGSSGTNIKQEASKGYDLSTQKGTVKGTNLSIEGTADVAVTGGIIKFNS